MRPRAVVSTNLLKTLIYGETMDIELYLPWPPTVNDYYGVRVVKKRRIPYIKAKGKLFRGACEQQIAEQVGYLNIDEHLLVEVELYPPDKRRRDLDNYMKPLLDAITHAQVWADDSLIDQLFIYRGHPVKHGAVVVKIGLSGPLLTLDTSG